MKAFVFLLFSGLLTAQTAARGSAPCYLEGAATAGQRVWLLCQRGEILLSEDQGRTWRIRPLPSAVTFRAITFLDSRRGFVAGEDGTLLATKDGGSSWTQVPLPTQANLTSIHFVAELGWLSGWSGLILHTTDGGATWSPQPTGVLQGLESVYFVDSQHGWTVGWLGTILRTTDGGQTWQRTAANIDLWSLNAIYFRDPSRGWAVGFNGQILRTRDGGVTWERQASPVQKWLTSVQFDASGRGWIAADNQLLMSEDDGESWKPVPVEGAQFLYRLLPLKNSLWAVGRFGVLRQTGSRPEFQALSILPEQPPSG